MKIGFSIEVEHSTHSHVSMPTSDISLDLEDREVVFSPPPEEDELTRTEVAPLSDDKMKEMMSETDLGKKLEPATKPVPPAPLFSLKKRKENGRQI